MRALDFQRWAALLTPRRRCVPEPTHAQYCLVRDGLYQLLREHPDWGVDTVFQRQGTPHCEKYGRRINATAVIGPHGCEKDWRYLNQSLPDGCYLKDAQGRYLTLTGALATNHSQPPKVLRPTTAAGAETNSCPDTIFSAEWRAFRTHGHYKAAGLPRPIDRINNDGEYNVGYMNAATTIDPATGTCAFDRDPQVVADYKNSGIAALANGRPDWYSFVSRWRARFSTQFSDAITNDPLSPEYRNASFTEYQVEGTDLFYGEWNETRQINTAGETNTNPSFLQRRRGYPDLPRVAALSVERRQAEALLNGRLLSLV